MLTLRYIVRRVMNISVDNSEAPKINVLLHDIDMGIKALNDLSTVAAAENNDNLSAENIAKNSARSAAGSGSVVAALRRRALAYNPDQLSFLLLVLTDTKAKVTSFLNC